MKIAVACGGTGGHIFPGLASAQALRKRGHDVTLWLAGREVEGASVAGWDGMVLSVKASGFPSGFSFKAIAVTFRLLLAFLQCRRRMWFDRPDVLLAMGSYASVGPVLAAHSLGVPVVLHESNVVPGRAISFLSRYATAVAIVFEEARAYLKHRRIELTGFPMRAGLLDQHFESGLLKGDHFTVLVMGGSQGAHRLNEVVPQALIELKRRGVLVQGVHLAGRCDADEVRRVYEQAGVPVVVFGFLQEMGKAYRAAHVAVARAGAATCTELCEVGLPAVLVPLPSARRDHQLANARAMEARGAVDVIEEKDLTPARLADYLEACYKAPAKFVAMREKLRASAMPGAAERIALLVENVVNGLYRGDG